jgi:hypothetical protein
MIMLFARFGVRVLAVATMAAAMVTTAVAAQAPQGHVVRVAFLSSASTSPSDCDSNYEGACVPVARDVDCAGGSGNGPAYVEGPVRVVGQDIYQLDADKNGVGCE